jgi:hypothetical protein
MITIYILSTSDTYFSIFASMIRECLEGRLYCSLDSLFPLFFFVSLRFPLFGRVRVRVMVSTMMSLFCVVYTTYHRLISHEDNDPLCVYVDILLGVLERLWVGLYRC